VASSRGVARSVGASLRIAPVDALPADSALSLAGCPSGRVARGVSSCWHSGVMPAVLDFDRNSGEISRQSQRDAEFAREQFGSLVGNLWVFLCQSTRPVAREFCYDGAQMASPGAPYSLNRTADLCLRFRSASGWF